jgi:tetratricopeptide (TPR) repeat protein
LISQTVQSLQQKDAATLLLIRCLKEWGVLCYWSSNLEGAKNKVEEAEKLCLSSSLNNSTVHTDIFYFLARLYKDLDALNDAEALYQKALVINKSTNNNLG